MKWLVVALIFLPGCGDALANNEHTRPALPETLHFGDLIHYSSGAMDVWLEASEKTTITDTHRQTVEVIALRIAIAFGNGDQQTAVSFLDAMSGLQLGLAPSCVFTTRCIGYNLYTEVQGLPAPFGFGWNATSLPGALPYFHSNHEANARFLSTVQGDCYTVRSEIDSASPGWTPAYVLPPKTAKFCHGAPIPTELSSNGETLILQSIAPGHGQPIRPFNFVPAEAAWLQWPVSEIPQVAHSYPEGEGTSDPFSTADALGAAIQNDARVQDFTSQNENYFVAESTFQGVGSGSAGTINFSESPRRLIWLSSPVGDGLEFLITKYDTIGIHSRFEVSNVNVVSSQVSPVENGRAALTMASAIETSAELVPTDLFGTYAARVEREPGVDSHDAKFQPGYQYAVRFEGPAVATNIQLLYEIRWGAQHGRIVRAFTDESISRLVDLKWFEPAQIPELT